MTLARESTTRSVGRGSTSFFRQRERPDSSKHAKPILVMEEVYKYFRRDVPTLKNVNLKINRGEFVFVTGPSGAGKSTLLQLIYRKHTVDSGRILFSGRDVARLTKSSIPFLRRNLGVIFQDFKIISHWSTFENVAVALEILSIPKRLIRSRVAEALDRVGLAGRGNEHAGDLSGGEQQRVAIARALVKDPPILLCDEPTGELDFETGKQILSALHSINEASHKTVLVVTHNAAIGSIAHRVMRMRSGEIVEDKRNPNPIDPLSLRW